MKEFKKALRALLLALLAYLVQACVMEYLTVSGVTGSVLFAVLAIITVSYGKKYAFCASCIEPREVSAERYYVEVAASEVLVVHACYLKLTAL